MSTDASRMAPSRGISRHCYGVTVVGLQYGLAVCLHGLFHAGLQKCPVHRIAGQKAADHRNLHDEPKLRRIDLRLAAEASTEPDELSEGHEAVHADLPSRDRGEIGFQRLADPLPDRELPHRLDREILKGN